jgi:preprotein translocase subunit SecG
VGRGEKDRKMGDVWDDMRMMIILTIALFLAFAIGLAVVMSRQGKDSSNDQKTP